jgi:hypothetical protein
LASCTSCAKFTIVDAGSEVNVNPFFATGVNGGLVAGVVVVTAKGAFTVWTAVALNVDPLLNDVFILGPDQ